MQNLILTLHIIVCVLLMILVLLQSGKEGMGVIFGGGNSSVFGSAGAGGILAKLTALMGVIFIITSLSYTYVTSSRTTSESAVLKVKIEEDVPTPPSSPAKEEAGAKPETENPGATTGAAPSNAAETKPETGSSGAETNAAPSTGAEKSAAGQNQ